MARMKRSDPCSAGRGEPIHRKALWFAESGWSAERTLLDDL